MSKRSRPVPPSGLSVDDASDVDLAGRFFLRSALGCLVDDDDTGSLSRLDPWPAMDHLITKKKAQHHKQLALADRH